MSLREKNVYAEALTPNLNVFGGKAFKEVIKVKFGRGEGVAINLICLVFL